MMKNEQFALYLDFTLKPLHYNHLGAFLHEYPKNHNILIFYITFFSAIFDKWGVSTTSNYHFFIIIER